MSIFWLLLICGGPTVWLMRQWQLRRKLIITAIWVFLAIGFGIYSQTPSGKAAYAIVLHDRTVREQKEAVEQKAEDERVATEQAQQAKAQAAEGARQAAQQAKDQVAQTQAEAHQQNEQQAEQNEKDADANYRQKVLDNNTQITSSLQTLRDLFNNPNFNDDTWKISVAASLVTLNKLCTDGQSISCPERFQAVQNSYRASLAEYEKFSDDLPSAIDNQDMNKIHECLERLNRGAALMEKATEEAKQINDN